MFINFNFVSMVTVICKGIYMYVSLAMKLFLIPELVFVKFGMTSTVSGLQ